MSTYTDKNALVAQMFFLEIPGFTLALFKSVSGLETTVDVIEQKVATKDGKTVVQKYPGSISFGDITLSRGVTDSLDLVNWHKSILEGKIDANRKDGSIVLYNQSNEEKARWNFERAWPSKVSLGALDAGSNEVAVEEMTIVVENLDRVK